MKKIGITLYLVLLTSICFSQSVNKLIKEENVTRVINTLAADEMKGRSAEKPTEIEKATIFIENEFKGIGLQTLPGLTTYRQEFSKDQIIPLTLEVMVNGNIIAKEKLLLVSESTSINFTEGLEVKSIDYDSSITNKRQHFFRSILNLTRNDTSSSMITVAQEFESEFNEVKSYFGKRFTSNQKSTKVFILGKHDVTHYSIRATQKLEPLRMANVVGVVPGKSKADEFVVFSGHYDHIGILKAVEGDSISNGADDDASGTTAVIELARYFKKVKNNERTLIFVAFTAEEIGGFGSKYFSEQLNPDKVMAMFNIEMIGKPSKWGQNFAFITGYERSDFGEILQKNLKGTPFQFKPDPYPTQNLFYRSDNATLARLGVPAHTISTDEIDIDKFYHTVDDEVGTLDMKNITATIRAIALSSKSIVNGKDTPKRIDKATVK